VDRRLAIAIGALIAAAALTLLVLLAFPPSTGPEVPAVPRGRTRSIPVPRAIRATLPPPPDIERPALPEEPLPPAQITPEDRRQMNFAVDGVLKAARAECIGPWLANIGAEQADEFVFDAVLYEGRLYEVGLRAMGHDIPPDVLDCVADRVWYAEWPEWDLPGELRLQRSLQMSPTR
jgi:hypothetical protein